MELCVSKNTEPFSTGQISSNTLKNNPLSANLFLKGLMPSERAKHVGGLQKPSLGARQNSLLLDLPAELRNRIYEFALLSDEYVQVDRDLAPGPKRSLFPSTVPVTTEVIKEPGLLRSCAQIRMESTEMYYSRNRFASHGRREMLRWIKNLDATRQEMLKDIRYTCAENLIDARAAYCGTVRPMDLVIMQLDVDLFETELHQCDVRVETKNLHICVPRRGPESGGTWTELEAEGSVLRGWQVFKGLLHHIGGDLTEAIMAGKWRSQVRVE